MKTLPEKDRKLEDLEKQGFTHARVTYKKIPGGKRTHRVKFVDLAEPWDGHKARGNRLESTWRETPRLGNPKKGKPELFPVEEVEIVGNGKALIKWTVWFEARQLTTNQMELYAVMRAEHKYIDEGYKKTASKYFSRYGGEGDITENSGVDNFFVNSGKYIICESKFMSSKDKFDDLKEDTTKVWRLVTKNRKSWPWAMTREWIVRSGTRAGKSPAGLSGNAVLTEADKKILDEVERMNDAIEDWKNITRVANIYGANEVPIYPGRYRFICRSGRGTRLSTNVLHAQWKFQISPKEFITLGDPFDKWVKEERKK